MDDFEADICVGAGSPIAIVTCIREILKNSGAGEDTSNNEKPAKKRIKELADEIFAKYGVKTDVTERGRAVGILSGMASRQFKRNDQKTDRAQHEPASNGVES
jgi:hypothetical protein